ncbi:MAG: efflux RND transporter permease subunit [Deltaproteobacteria bacterium]|nr:efflux RND transporter permease subunit [Deltaproteobacteria bacterium]
MSALVRWAAENRLLALLVAAIVMAIGLWSLSRLPIDAVPDVTPVQVQVVTRAPALSATEMETQVTQPVERAMAGLPGLKQTRSITKLGISIVWLTFVDDVDTYFARSQVNERLLLVRDRIPADIGKPEMGPISTGLGEIYMFELRSSNPSRSQEELRTIVEWQLGARLRQVPGVIEVVGFGGSIKQYRVTLDPARLAAHAISVEQVRDALQRDNALSGGGYLEQDGEQVVLRGDARFRGVEDIAATVVRTDEHGVPIRVGQVAEVDTGPALRQGAMTRDGRGEIVGASVLMLKGQNSRDVVTRVKAAIEAIKPTLPPDLVIEPYYDRAEFINGVIKTIAKNLSEGALITVLCLVLTLGSLRAGFLVAGAIPFSLLVGFIGLKLVGYSGNVMSLGAVDFGIVVEGTVLTVEHALTDSHGEHDKQKRIRALLDAMMHVARPAVFGVIITLLVFLPLATLSGIEGKMFRPVVLSLVFMLAGSLLYALVFVPAVAGWVLTAGKPGAPADPWLTRVAKRYYAPLLDGSLKYPKTTLAAAALVTALGLGLGAGMGADFLPRVFEGAFAVDALRPPSTSLTQAIALGKETEQALKETPEVETVVNRIGRPEGAVDPAGPESSDVFVILKPREQWRKGLTPEKLVDELSAKVSRRVPATINAFSQPIEMRVNDIVAGARGDVVVKVFGSDLEQLNDTAEKIRKTLMAVPGAADVRREVSFGLPSIRVLVDRERAGRLGVQPRAVLDLLATTRAGLPVGVVREGEPVFDLILRFGSESIQNSSQLGRLPITTQKGKPVPVSMVADIEQDRTIVQISREQMQRRVVVQANVRGRDMVGFVQEAKERARSVEVPRGVQLEWGGQFQNFIQARNDLAMLIPIALGIIALMLVITFGKVRYAVVTMLNLPFALAGGVIALWIRGLPFSIPAGVGFVALCGVSVITGIVMTSNLLPISLDLPKRERVRQAALASLRARISTALIAAVGFVPAAIATGKGAEVQRPLATVVIGGLIMGMILSLPALPAMLLYVTGGKDEEPRKPASQPTE